MPLQGLVTYPGIQQFEDFTITDISGISPSIGVMTIYPQYGYPSLYGDLTLTYDTNTIVFPNCVIDSASYERNSGGQIVRVRFFDERWKWERATITGRYNIRAPDNFILPAQQKTPQQLATLCFQAMGVTNFDVSALPNDARPEVDWNPARPAEELAKICDDLGCRIVPQRSTGKWFVRVVGDGASLPDGLPYQDAGNGIDPKEFPDYIKITTAPTKYQVALKLEPVAKDLDQSWKTLDVVSYSPNSDPTQAYGFGQEPKEMALCSRTRELQPDGSRISPQELAIQTVFRCWRVYDTSTASTPTLQIPGYTKGNVNRKQLILSDELVQTWVDYLGAEHARPALIFGSFFDDLTDGSDGNKPPGTRIDYQATAYRDLQEERSSFSLSLDPIDNDRTIVTTSRQMVFQQTPNSTGQIFFKDATLFLACSVLVRDATTWQPVRVSYLKQIGAGTNQNFVAEYVKDEIQPWSIADYDVNGNAVSTSNNNDEVKTQCQYYADAIAKTFETVLSSTRTYIGLFGIDMDGAIEQVTYRIGKQGADTIASRGTEHNFDIPPYLERRQREGRKDALETQRLKDEILRRQIKLRGKFNT
jgi:hypothetical protein